MKILRLVLYPVTFIYALVVIARNLFFDLGFLKSHRFSIPIISVGNLTVGGAGKSPMTEYLVRLLKDKYHLATLSRGYGRKTAGFLPVSVSSSAAEVGDEPLQFKHKFQSVTVAVAEKRVEGINKLLDHELIILDDAYQHRSVQPGFSVLLYDFNDIFKPQWFLPSGNLREPLSARKRANCIVVTKSPATLSERQKEQVMERINPFEHQEVFFSYLEYDDLRLVETGALRSLNTIGINSSIILLTGIANPKPLLCEISKYTDNIIHHSYSDHHTFTTKNITKIANDYHKLVSVDKLVITTEKDFQRLRSPEMLELLRQFPVYILPVKAAFEATDKSRFDLQILNYVTEHLHHS